MKAFNVHVIGEVSDDSEDDEPPRWPGLEQLVTLAGVKVKIHGLVSSLGRQLNGCVGTIVRVDDAFVTGL